MAKISIICARIKNDLEKLLDASWIQDSCKRLGYRWRQRLLGPVETVHLFILQLLAENTALNHLRHLAGAPISAQAICDAKARLPLGDLLHAEPTVSISSINSALFEASPSCLSIAGFENPTLAFSTHLPKPASGGESAGCHIDP